MKKLVRQLFPRRDQGNQHILEVRFRRAREQRVLRYEFPLAARLINFREHYVGKDRVGVNERIRDAHFAP